MICCNRREDGTMSLELAIIAPMLLLILVMFIAFGRFGQTTGLIEQGVRDSARSATQARSPEGMYAAVENVRASTAEDLPQSCGDSLRAQIDYGAVLRTGNFVTVQFTCTLQFGDLALPLWPNGKVIERSFTSRLDPNRGVYQ